MDTSCIHKLANQLFLAEQNRKAILPLTEQYPGITVDDAYAIQLANVKRAQGMGHTVSGKKIGLTSAGIQAQLGVDEPDFGHLFAAMDCAGGKVATKALVQPKIEAELAFVLKADLAGGQVTVEDVCCATEYVVGAFEIVDSRVADWRIKLADTVADNASSGRYVLGQVRRAPNEVDLPGVTMKLYKNGALAGQGAGSAVLGNPCAAVAWLANRLWDYGVVLGRGEVILSGAFSAAPAAAAGDRFTAEFSDFGTITADFV